MAVSRQLDRLECTEDVKARYTKVYDDISHYFESAGIDIAETQPVSIGEISKTGCKLKTCRTKGIICFRVCHL